MKFKRGAIIILVAMITLLVSVITAAGAAPEFVWKVNKKTLEKGSEMKEFSIVAPTTLTLAGSGAEIECTGVALAAGTKAFIFGAVPGSNSESLTTSGCTVKKPTGCTTTGIKFKALESEIVEGVESEGDKEKALMLLHPASGGLEGEFGSFNLSGATCDSCNFMYGSVVAEISPEKSEAQSLTLKFPVKPIKKFKRSGGAEVTIELKSTGAMTLTGSIGIELTSKEKFGAF